MDDYYNYVKNIVHYLFLTENEISENDLIKVSNYILNRKISVEFNEKELDEINNSIKENNCEFFFDLLKVKQKILIEKEKEILLSNVDLLEFITNECYELWSPNLWDNNLKDRTTFLSFLSNFERIVVKLEDLDSQIKKGGFSKWYEDGYYSDYDEIINFIKYTNFQHKDILLDIFDDCSSIVNSINSLNTKNDFYKADYKTRLDLLDENNKKYLDINDKWIKYIENHFYENMPEKYLEKLEELNTIKI